METIEKTPRSRASLRKKEDVEKHIKTTLLQLLLHTECTKITVSMLCREASIGRSTFYVHYDMIEDVVDDILEDIYSETPTIGEKLFHDGYFAEGRTPLCEFVFSHPNYWGLFQDAGLSSRILHKSESYSRAGYLASLRGKTSYSEEEMIYLHLFQLSGCMTLIRETLLKHKNTETIGFRPCVDKFLKAGFRDFLDPACRNIPC